MYLEQYRQASTQEKPPSITASRSTATGKHSARFTMTDIRAWLCTMTTTIVSLAASMGT